MSHSQEVQNAMTINLIRLVKDFGKADICRHFIYKTF